MLSRIVAAESASIHRAADHGADWRLAQGEALKLPIGPGPRELKVLEGRVWLTRDGRLNRPALDIWLEAGDSLAVPSGAELVLEAWPQARFQLLVPPLACPAVQRRPVTVDTRSHGLVIA
ncbi:DUF2917 domain-containing protein [Roseateles sp. DB2]|uniref:DUF2917 domain-containing protein n=1 Tax=Roseateles sp. DB2 TaxID=3453717 RepID=UPI003EEA1D05